MKNSARALELLRTVASNVHIVGATKGPLTQVDLQRLKLAIVKLGPKGVLGIRRDAIYALTDLTEALIAEIPEYARGCIYDDLRKQVGIAIIDAFLERTADNATVGDVTDLEQTVAAWFAGQVDRHDVYVPCILPLRAAHPFFVGPVHFMHGYHFVEDHLKPDQMLLEVTVQPLLQAMSQAYANWMAQLSIDRCTRDRAREWADLAVDLALTGVQLALQTDDSK